MYNINIEKSDSERNFFMKALLKLFTVILCVISVFAVPCITANAEVGEFKDTLEDNYPLCFEKSDKMRYEKNKDTGKTFYEKYSENGDVGGTEYVVYKMDDDIISFKIDCMHVNGLGDADTDISVFVSENNRDWKQVKIKTTPQTFDENLYINEEMAYWMMSSVTNRDKIEPGCKFIKIQINPFTVKDSCVWNTVLNTVTVKYGTEEASESEKEESTDTNGSSSGSTQSDTDKPQSESGKNTVTVLIAAGSAAVAAAAVVCAVLIVKSKKKK